MQITQATISKCVADELHKCIPEKVEKPVRKAKSNITFDETTIVEEPTLIPIVDSSKRHRNYMFTLNNYTSQEVKQLKEHMENNKYLFLCFGFEVGESGTPHLQGYVELHTSRSMSALHKDKGWARTALFVRGGTKLQAVTYCAKELIKECLKIEIMSKSLQSKGSQIDVEKEIAKLKESNVLFQGRTGKLDVWRKQVHQLHGPNHQYKLYWEAGDFSRGLKPGTRTDINVVKETVNNGGNMLKVIDVSSNYQSMRMGELMLKYRAPTRTWKTLVIWIWGPTGTGKTGLAINKSIGRHWLNNGDLQWFDTYAGHETVIFDDFRLEQAKNLSWFLRLTDKYPLSVPVKGGFTDWVPQVIFITSPFPPEMVFPVAEDSDLKQVGMSNAVLDDNAQALRRINKVIHLTHKHEETLEQYTTAARSLLEDPELR